jgi:GT2 family glycosyltransferase
MKIAELGDNQKILQATAVIVLYQMDPESSPAFCSLIEARSALSTALGRVSIILWDNSRSPCGVAVFPDDVTYIHDPRNPGLATAYNKSLDLASQNESQWLITLDQDSAVPREYLLRMATAARECSNRAGVGAIVPEIALGSKQLSPNYFLFGGFPRWFPSGFRGIPEQQVFAFNSGAMVRIDALRQIGGYDPRFPLDHSDAALFHRLHQHGKRIYIEGSIQLRHEFSMADMNRRMHGDRYRSALLAESAFWDLHMNWLAGCERTARLSLRMVRHWMRKDRADLRRVTREFLTLRLFRSRKTRLERWNDSFAEQNHSPSPIPVSRPKVSVCMTAYNGARFIEAQLHSVLSQIAENDEIVVVDDGSIDDTVARIARVHDPRIRLLAHEQNEGVAAGFEDALRHATGDILFLCDHDDIWAPTKAEEVLREFSAHPEAQIVITRAALIDEHGAPLPDSRINRYGKFVPGFWRNVAMNHYQGSAMAIRASLLGRVLPFPRHKRFQHDVWMGTRNDAAGGKTVFIDKPLLYYRRHDGNLSRRHRSIRLVLVRIELLLAHLSRLLVSGSSLRYSRTP